MVAARAVRRYRSIVADDKRFQVFVSSTYLDLREERRAVVETLLEVDAFPAGMELFPATDDDAWTLIESVIADSDYYLLIVGGKYGSVDPDLDVSYTEREYDAAVRLGKPVMAFLHGDPEHLTVERSETDEGRRKKLAAFRDKVKKAKHVKYWTNADDLAGKVARSWVQFVKRYPAVGWIRADQASSGEQLAALAKAQKQIEDLTLKLEQARTQAPAGAADLAQGNEDFDLPVWLSADWWTDANSRVRSAGVWKNVSLSWDRVFGFMGLSMMQEADDDTLRDSLLYVANLDHASELSSALRARLMEVAGEAGISIADIRHREKPAVLSDDDFQTVLLQLTALGLIQHSQRPRSVKDTAKYWALTPFGQTRLVQIRALQRGEFSLERDDVFEMPIEEVANVTFTPPE